MLDKTLLLKILGVSEADFDYVLANLDEFYYLNSEPKINKKTGKPLLDRNGVPRTRDLYPATGLLKAIQFKLYHNILKKIKLPEYCFGGVVGRDNIRNAKMHQGNKFFFLTDLRNFYPGINNGMVYETLLKKGIPRETARLITQLTSYKGMLPQGTHTSPYLANLVFTSAGLEIQALCEKHNLTFTSYVDDITISSATDFKDLTFEVIRILEDKGFKISHNKTFYKIKLPNVTGVLVMNNGLDLSGAFKQQIQDLQIISPGSADGKQHYYERVKKISKTKLSKVKQGLRQS